MDQPGAPALSDADRFDMFSHWLVAEREYPFPDKRYWKIAPGEKGWQWEECRENGFIGIGWNDVGDVSGLSRAEFDTLQDEMEAERGYKKEATNQVWTFAHDIQEGDVIVANRGTREILGFGIVVGPYEFVPDGHYAHQFPVRWDDTVPRRVDEKGWRRTLIEIKPEKYEELRAAPPLDGARQPEVEEAGSDAESLFSVETFDLLAGLHEDPTKAYYQEHREAIRDHEEKPFRRLVRGVARRLPAPIAGLMETEKGIFARILKNDYGKGGAWDFYWGAFYPKGGKRIEDAQLMMVINRDHLEFGFYIGHYGSDQRERFLDNCRRYREELIDLLEPVAEEGFVYGEDKGGTSRSRGRSLSQWLENIDEAGLRASTVIAKERVSEPSAQDLIDTATRTFELLFPFVLLATSEDPMPEIIEYIGEETGGPETEPEYGIEQLSRDTGIGEEKLRRWVRTVERKGQAIFYGPPGTGKTFIAQHLAKYLTGGGDGFYDLVQFHPSYSYEDFVQGIRPESRDGTLSYPVVPGRFKEFCREAAKRRSPCVLIVDEINRANLSRVFGELMYLLEYRKEEVPLAGGGKFRIPENVRLIGTMNTADRSIALVDHALRRRFAFLELYPDYELLRKYHSTTGFPVDNLIGELMKLNQLQEPRPVYSVRE
jgi:5-methylcytosine-specific restriction protein B